MKEWEKWRFRDDMLFHYINADSIRTFQDAEDRLNFLEEKYSNVLEDLKSLKKYCNGDEDIIMKQMSFEEYIQTIIDNLENN